MVLGGAFVRDTSTIVRFDERRRASCRVFTWDNVGHDHLCDLFVVRRMKDKLMVEVWMEDE